jgi:glycerol 2-dehydrogenase (NADP+)
MDLPMVMTLAPEIKPLRKYESPTIQERWKMMEAIVGSKCWAIDVGNFTQNTIGELLEIASAVSTVCQVELHAFHPNVNLVPWCAAKGIRVIRWR